MGDEDTTLVAITKTSSKDLEIGGTKTKCTREGFDAELAMNNVCSQCTLQDVGTFYFPVFPPSSKDTDKKYTAHVLFYNQDEGMAHVSTGMPFSSPRELKQSCHAIDQNTFVFDSFMITLNEEWTVYNVIRLSHQFKNVLAGVLFKQTDVQRTGLSRIKKTAATDFTLVSDDGKAVFVHKSVLEGLWPFFKVMVDSNMEERYSKRVTLSMPKSTLDVLVQYLYGEELDLHFEDAANLIVCAQMYDLPELLDIASEKVKQETLTIQQAIHLWHKAFEANNDDIREYAAGKIEGLNPKTADLDAQIEEFDKNELVSLFCDVMAIKD